MNVELKAQLQEKYTSLIRSALIRRVLKNSGYLFSASGISAGLSLLQGILLARLLGVEQFGLWGTITLFTGVVNNLASFRMDELVIKYVGQFTEMKDIQRAAAVFKAAAGVELASSLVAYGLIWLLAPLAALYLAKDQTLTSWFLVYGLVVLFNLIFESSNGLLRIFDRFRNIALINVFQSALALLLTALAFVGTQLSWISMPLPPLMIVILIFMISKLAGALGMTWLALREAVQHWGEEWWKAPLVSLRGHIHELGRFAVSTNLSASINLINKDSELLWVAYFRNPVEVGYYKLALALINIILLPINPMPSATYAELAREVARRQWKNVRDLLTHGSMVALSYTLIIAAGILLVGKPFIQLAYGVEFLPAYPALLILTLGFLAANTFYWQRVALLAFGLPHFLTFVNLIAAVFKVAGYFTLVPRFGYLGCAALLAAYHVFSSVINTIKTFRELKRAEQQPEAV